jgi:hypothetical protein
MSLSSEQVEMLQSFQEISQIHDEELAIQILTNSDWNLEAALSQFIGQEDDFDHRPARNERNINGTAQPPPSSVAGTSTHRSETPPTALTPTETAGGGLLDLLMYPLQWLFQVQSTMINPARDAQRFISDFNSSFGLRGPRFHDNSYQSAVATAFRESKFLLIYLHSPLHEDTDRFCEQVLCSPQFVEMTSANVVLWGGRVFDPEAYGLSTQLGVSAYPFMALLICQSARSAQIADRIQG